LVGSAIGRKPNCAARFTSEIPVEVRAGTTS
jgi:hypothetical protein